MATPTAKTGNCKDCKWWAPVSRGAWGKCEGVDMEYADTLDDTSFGRAGEAIVVVVGDYYGADGSLGTGPMFGCTLFEPREDGGACGRV